MSTRAETVAWMSGANAGERSAVAPVVTRAMVVAKAREYLDTPWVHQGRLKFKGVDCVGFPVCLIRELGLRVIDYKRYGRSPNTSGKGPTLSSLLALTADQIEGEAQLGDILEFGSCGPDWPHHIAIRTDIGIIHSSAELGRVRETSYGHPFTTAFVRAYHIRGVRY